MAKFFKSLFQIDKRRKSFEIEADEDLPPALDGRRKLSVSRSGRMRQAQKKRLSLSLDLYGEDHKLQMPDKTKKLEYHVNPTNIPVTKEPSNSKRRSIDSRKSSQAEQSPKIDENKKENNEAKQRKLTTVKTPEEEIDKAFEIIDKS